MLTWIIVSVGLAVLMIPGLLFIIKKFPGTLKIKSVIMPAIFIPILFAYFWANTLIDIFPGLTIIDLCAGLLLGMISGFFIALSLVKEKV